MLDKNFTISRGQQFYFQLVPIEIRIEGLSVLKQLSKQTTFKIVLYKGIQKQSETNHIAANIMNLTVPVENANLNFSLQNYSPQRNMNFTIRLLKNHEEIGTAIFDVPEYIQRFKNNQDFTEVQLPFLKSNKSFDFKIMLQVFVNKSRFNLQKTVRSKRTQSMADSRQNSVQSSVKLDKAAEHGSKKREKQSSLIRRSNIILRSQTSSQSSGKRSYASYTKQDQKFMSNSKKYVRKQDNERRILLKSSRTNSQKSDQQGKQRVSLSSSRNSYIKGKQLSPKNSGRPSPKNAINASQQLSQTGNIGVNQSSARKFVFKSVQIQKVPQQQKSNIQPSLTPRSKAIPKYQDFNDIAVNKFIYQTDRQSPIVTKPKQKQKIAQQKYTQAAKQPPKKSKQDAQKKISFVQRTNSIVINTEQELQQHKLKLTQSIRKANLNASSKLKPTEDKSQRGSQKSINVNMNIKPTKSIVHTIKQSRNSKLQKQSIKQNSKQSEDKQNNYSQAKNKIIIVIFFIFSLFLMYNAMSPSKKYTSRKRKA